MPITPRVSISSSVPSPENRAPRMYALPGSDTRGVSVASVHTLTPAS